LTDETCHNEECHVPLLRSPNGQKPEIYFCANCDGEPTKVGSSTGAAHAARQASPPTRPYSPSLALSSSSAELQSRSSTPATDIPSSLNSPTFAPLPPTAETLRRRQQSDAAAAQIGSRLLKGWAMLADECPNSNCFGIPLVRPPQAGYEKSTKKECVACGTVYIDEGHGLVITNTNANALAIDLATRDNSTGSMLQSDEKRPERHSSLISPPRRQDSKNTLPASMGLQSQSTFASLDSAAASLDLSLRSLSKRLAVQSSSTDGMDVMSIGSTADAMGKVLSVMERIQNLRSASGP